MAAELHPHERIVWSVIILGGIMTLIFGFAFVGNRITEPLRLKPQTTLAPEEQASADTEALKHKDTDHDGLSDYDEIYVYHTSPYLADTDSDGYDDKTEVDSGNDPNCPKGKTCGAVATPEGGVLAPQAAGSTVTTPSSLIPPPAAAQLFNTQGGLDSLSQMLTSIPADQIRDLLKKQGVSDTLLKQLDDATLKKLYDESVGTATAQLKAQSESARSSGSAAAPGASPSSTP